LRSPANILLLFDIDGTLIHSKGAGVRGMNRAFLDLFGWESALDDVPISGRTDRAILADVFERRGRGPATDPEIDRLRRAYLSALPGELADATPRSLLLPDVLPTLDALESDERFTLALLTGNFEQGARLKLEAAGVWHKFAFGAYGDDFVNRRDLVPVARTKAAAIGPPPDAVIVIGDTPLDVDCARVHGAIAVAVATGQFDVGSLQVCGADLTVETLAGLAPVAETLARLAAGGRSA
jgi:phosphoglycolate phosphatase-like HAD superfamily hydrolase